MVLYECSANMENFFFGAMDSSMWFESAEVFDVISK